jgi:hypothetical protein
MAISLVTVTTTLVVTESAALAWLGWTQVPGGGSTIDAPGAGGVGAPAFDRYVAVRGTFNGIHINHFRFVTGGWSGWSEIPGGGRTLSGPAVETQPNRAIVVVRGTNDGVYMNILNGSTWTGWGEIAGGIRTPNAPAIAIGPNNTLHVAIRTSTNRIYYNRFNFSSWIGWREIPGGGQALSSPAITTTRAGVSVFVRGTNDGIYKNTLNNSFTSWSGWGELPGGGRTNAGPSADEFSVGGIPARTDVSVKTSTGSIYVNSFPEPSGPWTGWRLVPGRTTSSTPAVVATQSAIVYIRGTDNRIYENIDG